MLPQNKASCSRCGGGVSSWKLMMAFDGLRVMSIKRAQLLAQASPWTYPEASPAAIERHWEMRQKATPALFNGTVYILKSYYIACATLNGVVAPADFKTYRYWRDRGHPQVGVRDGFGSAILLSAEGHVLLGRSGAETMLPGATYFIGGFIDSRDIAPDGSVDLDASVAREFEEETGLDFELLARQPGYWVTVDEPFVSIGIVLRSHLGSRELRTRILAHAERAREKEIGDIVVVRDTNDLVGLGVRPCAKASIRALFAAVNR
jgi:8-oxo-dGTP pyrophosphatase MutT (NUDIX family)